MNYEGTKSHPMIRMLVRLHHELLEIGVDPRWNDDGVECTLTVERNGQRFVINRRFSAEAARLILTTELREMNFVGADSSHPSTAIPIDSKSPNDGSSKTEQLDISFTKTYEVLNKDLDGVFLGKLLDQTTRDILNAVAICALPKSSSSA